MPIHDFRCQGCQKVEERFVSVTNLQEPQTHACGAAMDKVFLTPPMVTPDLPGYESPVSGEWIEGKSARRNDLARNDCVPWEPGMREENAKRREASARNEEKVIDQAFESTLAEMPVRKKETLEQEIRAGASAEIMRATPKGV